MAISGLWILELGPLGGFSFSEDEWEPWVLLLQEDWPREKSGAVGAGGRPYCCLCDISSSWTDRHSAWVAQHVHDGPGVGVP